MSESNDDQNRIIEANFDRLQDEYVQERYEECLYSSCIVFVNSGGENLERYKSASITFIYECVKRLVKVKDLEIEMMEESCSFCGKAPLMSELELAKQPLFATNA